MRPVLILLMVCLVGVARAEETPLGAPFRDCGQCPELVFVRAGTIDLGLERAPAGISRARLATRLAVGRFEVTFAEWDACVAERGCRPLHDQGWGRGRRPVVNVSFADAEAYLAWLRGITGQRYRLPRQEEWEYFVRSGVRTNDPWAEFKDGNCDPCDPTYAGQKTAPVGSYKPNGFGLYDVLGNVWEWTSDCVDGCGKRLMLGGSFRSGALFIAGGIRFEPMQGPASLIDVGFRVVRDEADIAMVR